VFARAIQRATGVPETGMDMGIQPLENQEQEGGSTDVGDVSWIVPTLTLTVASRTSEGSLARLARGRDRRHVDRPQGTGARRKGARRNDGRPL
jgi:metal-dependent amidase/aminoacylase/carboxypeptidase family protein